MSIITCLRKPFFLQFLRNIYFFINFFRDNEAARIYIKNLKENYNVSKNYYTSLNKILEAMHECDNVNSIYDKYDKNGVEIKWGENLFAKDFFDLGSSLTDRY